MLQTSVRLIWSCSFSLCSSVVLTLARCLFPSTGCGFSRVKKSCQVPGFSCLHWEMRGAPDTGSVRPSCCGWHQNINHWIATPKDPPSMILDAASWDRINGIKEVLPWREKCKMCVKHEFLLAAVRFYLLAVLDVVGILLLCPWVASSGEFKMCFDRKWC